MHKRSAWYPRGAPSESDRITAMVRRCLSFLLAVLVAANLVVWPTGALAEMLEHEHEAVQTDPQNPPVDPSPAHCKHGCAGHYGQHFQGQVPAPFFVCRISASRSVFARPEALPPQHIPALPFRPPLTASILT